MTTTDNLATTGEIECSMLRQQPGKWRLALETATPGRNPQQAMENLTEERAPQLDGYTGNGPSWYSAATRAFVDIPIETTSSVP